MPATKWIHNYLYLQKKTYAEPVPALWTNQPDAEHCCQMGDMVKLTNNNVQAGIFSTLERGRERERV